MRHAESEGGTAVQLLASVRVLDIAQVDLLHAACRLGGRPQERVSEGAAGAMGHLVRFRGPRGRGVACRAFRPSDRAQVALHASRGADSCGGAALG